MNELYDLKEMLCKELEDYGRKGELSAGSLDIIDKLAHTVKNIDKIIEMYDGGQSMAMGPNYNGGNSYGMGGYYDGNSYARGRGAYARRDSMGRYSSAGYSRGGDMMDKMQEIINEAPDERTRQDLQRIMDKMGMR